MLTHQPLPEQLGRYRLLKKLGAGGMGAVYLALDTQLDRNVALKVPQLGSEDSQVRERFGREARLAASIQHPNLCPVHDVGEDHGIPFFVMPFLEGRPLSHLIGAECPWQPRYAVEMVRQVALAVAALHQSGIVHRDLKPANVMIRPNGEPILMDFGLAFSFASQAARLTGVGVAMGTPPYMSPEQLSGDLPRVGPAADIYSLGVILFELVTGRLPFPGPADALFAQILHGSPPPPSHVRPGLDADVDRLCLKAIARDPGARFPGVREFADELAAYLRGGHLAVEGTECVASGGPVPALPPTEAPGFPHTVGPAQQTITVENQAMVPTLLAGRGRDRLWLVLTILLLLGGTATWAVWSRTHGRDDSQPEDEHRKDEGTELKSYTNTLGMKLVLLPPGKYQRGSPDEEPDRQANELPRHEVEITQPFYIATTEVTVGQFRRFVDENDYRTDVEREAVVIQSWSKNKFGSGDQQPVLFVSFHDAQRFCGWLSGKEARKYELPTEAEWEYACRAGTTTRYSFGDNPRELSQYAWWDGNAQGVSNPVGTKQPNRWGLFDMHGNVWEWCADYFGPYERGSFRDPTGPKREEGTGSRHVIRGGSWSSPERVCRSAIRIGGVVANGHTGFRVLMRPPAE